MGIRSQKQVIVSFPLPSLLPPLRPLFSGLGIEPKASHMLVKCPTRHTSPDWIIFLVLFRVIKNSLYPYLKTSEHRKLNVKKCLTFINKWVVKV